MAKDDMRRIIYAILKELYETEKDGKCIVPENINYERFHIPYSYWVDIVEELLAKGYIKGITIRETKTGRVVSTLAGMTITFEGVEFLEDNSTMKKVAAALKDIKDIVPGV